MSHAFRISAPPSVLRGNIVLEPSKSISNRALIIRSLCKDAFEIHHLSQSDDTATLVRMLSSENQELYAGHAGSSYRFMVARASLGDKEVKLDGSKQLRKRPIAPLVNALRSLGADITYLEKEGFPPLQIKPAKPGEKGNEVHLKSGVSSQYVSALLMIAPLLPNGLILHLDDDPVSVPYIRMTLDLMRWFGAEHTWEQNVIRVAHGKYVGRDFTVEGDWSAASYYYSLVGLSPKAEISIDGLSRESLQGDQVVKDIYSNFGVETTFTDSGVLLTKKQDFTKPKDFKFDFINHPDLAQTVMVTLAGLGVKGLLTGLKTLRIKETDRLSAMQAELAKVKVKLIIKEREGEIATIQSDKAKWKDKAKFNTYEDHRMAMAFAPLACLHPVVIRDPDVVSKSYPGFWKDLSSLGMIVEKIKL